MCSVFRVLEMDNFQGDLTDILRASGHHVTPSGPQAPSSWQPPDIPMSFPSSSNGQNSFGDPFLNMSDPLLHELNIVAASGTFPNSAADTTNKNNNNNNYNNSNSFMVSKIFEDDVKSQCSVFPRIRISQGVHEASPCNSPVISAVSPPRGLNRSTGPSVVASDVINVNTNSPKTCLLDNNTARQLQISSPRNLGLKRRKSQAKKVVCIPAPAAANSRSTGEVVPSDLWAWRKYGQKPIKGSPYPRGYYRCSSSKGCSARKQVERSRTDPNMLVITYTSEHNHPWPTQRNALAGSTRSTHTSKPNASASYRSSRQPSNAIEEAKDHNNMASPPGAGSSANNSNLSSSMVKEEVEDQVNNDQKQPEMDRDNDSNGRSYRPELISDFHQSEDFFAGLDELGCDPLGLLFPQVFGSGGDHDQKDKQALESFGNFFDWSGDNSINNSNASFGEYTRSL